LTTPRAQLEAALDDEAELHGAGLGLGAVGSKDADDLDVRVRLSAERGTRV
jgi:hypothetical protein